MANVLSFTMAIAVERQALDLLWPLFNFGRFLGCFPCKRILDFETGKSQLRPTNWKINWTIWFTVYLPLGFTGPFIPILIVGEGIDVFYQCMKTLNPVFEESYIDNISVMLLMSLSFLLNLLTHFGNSNSKHGLCTIENFGFNRSRKSDTKIMKPLITLITMTLIFFGLQTGSTFHIFLACKETSHHLGLYLVGFIAYFLSMIIFAYPVYVFFGVILEYFTLVLDICKQLEDQPFPDPVELLKKSWMFWKLIETIQKILSFNVFCTTIILSVKMLILLYMTSFQLVSNLQGMTMLHGFGQLSLVAFFLTYFLLFWYMNILSQKVTDKVHGLGDYLRHFHVPNDSDLVEFEGHNVPISIAKTCLLKKLDDFQGFDGKGYFTLGKSLLKNLLAFCVTYLVILVQFRLTERSDLANDTSTKILQNESDF